ncbi:MAG: hypothetical protein ARM1_0321 [Candidatus Micrarchaeota archaeon]|nr:MAG: hypothetical protein ARM1_0321 [Candidatus Micrarchaeota archaeon]
MAEKAKIASTGVASKQNATKSIRKLIARINTILSERGVKE